MSDRSVIVARLKAAPDVLFVEPSAEIVTQDDVHDAAAALKQSRGLADDVPYVGWHTQSSAFTSDGMLEQPQRIYFGGDREAVAQALHVLEDDGFLVLGGRTDAEAFAIVRDAHPTDVDASNESAWRTRLVALILEQGAELRPGEDALLHQALGSDALQELQPPIVRALMMRGLLTASDLDHVLTEDGIERLAATRTARESRNDLPDVIVAAFDLGYPRVRAIAADLARFGWLNGAMLRAWGRVEPERARDAARAHAIATGDGLAEYLDLVEQLGGHVVTEAVAVSEESRGPGPEGVDVADITLVRVLVHRIYGGSTRTFAAEALRDTRLPAWLRAQIADAWSFAPYTPTEAAADREFERGLPDEVVQSWPGLVDDVRAEVGLPPHPGFDPEQPVSRIMAHDVREYMLATHCEGMRQALRRPNLSEPAAAALLDLLYPAGLHNDDALDTLLVEWRMRWFVKPAEHTLAPPALVTLLAAARDAERPEAQAMISAVEKDTRKWTVPLKDALIVVLDRGADADAEAEAHLARRAFSGDDGSESARFALCAVRARRRGITPLVSAVELLDESPERPGYISRGFALAALVHADAGSHLWPRAFDVRSKRAVASALSLAQDDSLSERARLTILELATESMLFTEPSELRPTPTSQELEELLGQLEFITGDLGM
ncbi:hypothetical protein ACSAGD_10485 [Paramicrobacterium sp. CJ85]|uniref:hypothetical protein n=1 Tax=Paramicrobacterium sp. CJ85 TaxID=3445355 RepID=UPI003F60B7CB